MKRNHRFHALLFALLAALLITSVAGAAPKNGAVAILSVDQGSFDASQDVLVTVNISNPTNHTVKILKWYTPVEGVEEPLFAVLVNGEPAAYTGAVYKRPAATGQDYIQLKAGESITSVVDLGEFYDLSQSGEYEVFYAAAAYNLYDPKGNNFKYREVLVSEKINVVIEGRGAKGGKPTPPPGSNTFNACTDQQQSLLLQARTQAQTYSNDAISYLKAGTQGPRYTNWFGVYSSSRYGTVTSHFTALKDAFDTKGITFDCGCSQNYYAYVYPNQPYKIYLCRVFWQAPMKGTDSKGGTLIHEMSHFNVVASTDDYVYGQSGAAQLAGSDPNKAVDNADNHEYFAENNPQQQ